MVLMRGGLLPTWDFLPFNIPKWLKSKVEPIQSWMAQLILSPPSHSRDVFDRDPPDYRFKEIDEASSQTAQIAQNILQKENRESENKKTNTHSLWQTCKIHGIFLAASITGIAFSYLLALFLHQEHFKQAHDLTKLFEIPTTQKFQSTTAFGQFISSNEILIGKKTARKSSEAFKSKVNQLVQLENNPVIKPLNQGSSETYTLFDESGHKVAILKKGDLKSPHPYWREEFVRDFVGKKYQTLFPEIYTIPKGPLKGYLAIEYIESTSSPWHPLDEKQILDSFYHSSLNSEKLGLVTQRQIIWILDHLLKNTDRSETNMRWTKDEQGSLQLLAIDHDRILFGPFPKEVDYSNGLTDYFMSLPLTSETLKFLNSLTLNHLEQISKRYQTALQERLNPTGKDCEEVASRPFIRSIQKACKTKYLPTRRLFDPHLMTPHTLIEVFCEDLFQTIRLIKEAGKKGLNLGSIQELVLERLKDETREIPPYLSRRAQKQVRIEKIKKRKREEVAENAARQRSEKIKNWKR